MLAPSAVTFGWPMITHSYPLVKGPKVEL